MEFQNPLALKPRTTFYITRADELHDLPHLLPIPGLFPAHRLCLVVGTSGAGLTQFACHLASCLAGPAPLNAPDPDDEDYIEDEHYPDLPAVLLISQRDNADVIKPRLKALGAKLRRIMVLSEVTEREDVKDDFPLSSEVLIAALRSGPLPVGHFKAARPGTIAHHAKLADLSQATILRAKKTLQITSAKTADQWLWTLPPTIATLCLPPAIIQPKPLAETCAPCPSNDAQVLTPQASETPPTPSCENPSTCPSPTLDTPPTPAAASENGDPQHPEPSHSDISNPPVSDSPISNPQTPTPHLQDHQTPLSGNNL